MRGRPSFRVDDCWCIFIRAFLAGICLEAKIALPEVARFSIDSRDFKCVMAIGDSLYAAGTFDSIQVGNAALHPGHPAHLRLSSFLVARGGKVVKFCGAKAD